MAKIYTKKGDAGETGLIGGTRMLKSHIKIESYGTVDELNCHIGVLRDVNGTSEENEMLDEIQNVLFVIGSHLAIDDKSKFKLPELKNEYVEHLESRIDHMDAILPPMRAFVLPGGHPSISACHVARAVCRRAERSVVRLNEESEVPQIILTYLNRLSDYLFVMSRWLAKTLDVTEIEWKP